MSRLETAWALLLLLVIAGCAAPGADSPVRYRALGFQAASVRRPAVHVRVSVERAGLGSGSLSDQERTTLASRYMSALLEALNAQAILPVDVSLDASTSITRPAQPLEGLDLARLLAGARQVGAEHLLIVDAVLRRANLVHCRETRRRRVGPTTYWEAGIEVARVSDGAPVLTDPGDPGKAVTDVELDCQTGRVERRRSMDEMIEESAKRALEPLARP